MNAPLPFHLQSQPENLRRQGEVAGRQRIAEIETAAERLRKDIAENKLGGDALLTRAVRAKDLRDRIRQYEEILGQALDVCHENLDTAVQAFSVASAVQADDEVFEGVFA